VRAGELIEWNRDAWRAATEHPFLAGLREGSLDPARFAAWLGQDYLFAGALLSFQARLLARAPRTAHRPWCVARRRWSTSCPGSRPRRGSGGCPWRRCPPRAPWSTWPCSAGWTPAPPRFALVALWALERVYRDAWQWAAPGAEPYREIVAHWTEPGFADYVAALEHLADIALTDFASAEQQTVFDEVLRLEIAFWDGGSATG
jgi:formylaminopyrimidine deformylase / aminopyrimidine aminohydrolase